MSSPTRLLLLTRLLKLSLSRLTVILVTVIRLIRLLIRLMKWAFRRSRVVFLSTFLRSQNSSLARLIKILTKLLNLRTPVRLRCPKGNARSRPVSPRLRRWNTLKLLLFNLTLLRLRRTKKVLLMPLWFGWVLLLIVRLKLKWRVLLIRKILLMNGRRVSTKLRLLLLRLLDGCGWARLALTALLSVRRPWG